MRKAKAISREKLAAALKDTADLLQTQSLCYVVQIIACGPKGDRPHWRDLPWNAIGDAVYPFRRHQSRIVNDIVSFTDPSTAADVLLSVLRERPGRARLICRHTSAFETLVIGDLR